MAALRIALLTACGLGAALLAGAAAVVLLGLYPVQATRQHFQFIHTLLETAMQRSVQWRAREVVVPDLRAPALLQEGAACFAAHCLQCHGAPGVAPGAIGLGMQPLPGPLADAARRWQPRELYWITRHGIRMSGMPAWEFRLEDQELWALVAFLQRLPQLAPADYAALAASAPVQARAARDAPAPRCGFRPAARDAAPPRAPDAERGRTALSQYACSACHRIPGITGSAVDVGPPLAGLASRQRIAGRLANTQDNMVRWLRDPRAVDPLTAMPDLSVTEADARDMAAYLATLD